MEHNQFSDLCHHSFNTHSNTSILFLESYVTIKKNLEYLKKTYPFNCYIIDCNEYYNDEEVVKLINLILSKKTTLMNDYMNLSLNTCTNKENLFIKHNNIFLVNIQSFKESNKNLIFFINNFITKHTDNHSHLFLVSCCNLQLFDTDEYNENDFINVFNNNMNQIYSFKYFKNYKIMTKYKKHIFPLNKIKITKKRIENHIYNMIFISKNNNTCLDIENKCGDYKSIIIKYLTCDNFQYSSIFNISHYENIPLILYENIKIILKTDTADKNRHVLYKEIRQLCIDFYSHSNEPDMYLFEKTNLYYFLFMYTKILNRYSINPCILDLRKLNFTKYYSNRASEIQYQKSINSLLNETEHGEYK